MNEDGVGGGGGTKRKSEDPTLLEERKKNDSRQQTEEEEVSSVLDAMKEFGISEDDDGKQRQKNNKAMHSFLKKAIAKVHAEEEEEEQDDEEEENVRSPFVVYVDVEERGEELFDDMEAARSMFPLPKLEATSLYMSAVDQNVLTQLTLPLLPITTPTPPLLLMLTGKRLPLYSNSFDLLLEYAALIKYVVQHDKIRSRRRLLQEELLRLNDQMLLKRVHIENSWDAYLAYYRTKNNLPNDEPAVYRDRLVVPLPPIDDLEEAVIRRVEKKETEETTAMQVVVDTQQKEKNGGITLTAEIEMDPEAKSEVTLAKFYTRLRSERSVPRMWIYRFMKLLPRAVVAGTVDEVYCDDILEDMYIQQHLYMEQMEKNVSSFLTTPVATEIRDDDGDGLGQLQFSRFMSELNREMTIRLVRLREITLLRMLSECSVSGPIVRSQVVMQWLAPLDMPRPIMNGERYDDDDDAAPLFYMMSPVQIRHIALYRRLFIQKRQELILDRTVIRDQYKRSTEAGTRTQQQQDETTTTLPDTPWTLDEFEAASLVRFLGRTYQNNDHRETVLHRAHALFGPAFIEWHSPETNRMLVNAANYLVANKRSSSSSAEDINMLTDKNVSY